MTIQVEQTDRSSPCNVTDENGDVSQYHLRNGHRKPSRLPWVVQKFGGTSIGKFPMEVFQDIVRSPRQGQFRVAVVCSARSDTRKDNGTTSRLLRAIMEAQVPGARDFETTIAAVRDEHIKAATTVIGTKEVIDQLAEEIDEEIARVLVVLRGAQQAQKFTEQTRDFAVSRGEKISCLFMTALLRSLGEKAVCIDLIDLSSSHSQDGARPSQLGRSIYKAITREITSRIGRDSMNGIPIITGFFGGMPRGLLRTVGRGYSDLCAALVAVALEAQELQIWKEVDGVFNADPRKVPTASLLASISPSEAAELSFYGAEVIHPSTMEHVLRASIPIQIKNVLNPGNGGTRIDPIMYGAAKQEHVTNGNVSIRTRRPRTNAAKKPPTKPVAVSVKQNMLVLNIQARDRSCSSSSYLAKIFSAVEQHGLKIDLISSSEMNVSLALLPSEEAIASIHMKRVNGDGSQIIEDHELRSALEMFDTLGAIDVLSDMAIISLIGDGLKQMVGVSAEFFSVLAKNDINIEMISQGASETNISAVIEGYEADRALIAIHRSLFKILPNMASPQIAGGKGWYLGA
ncbi:aspartate kinase [Ophiobolus disseminans]|uniref:aspartate kinase n=1 Tax=Ophiobolus disseminans TaxID=1469910 RepID=A0A6A6ZFD6_9PLEO|nr:aspartate kinase [Ophiobolus disseminans]